MIKEKNTDIYVLAHEIKNPLSVIKGYMEMLNENNLERYKKIIMEELNNSLDILDNYLEYNKLSVLKEIMDINLLFQDIKDNYTDYYQSKGINLEVQVVDNETYVIGNYEKLKQVFCNLIKNSMESHAKNIKLIYEVLNGKVIIEIIDDGLGCSYINQIGDNYTSKILGNGIGTTLSRKIIDLLDGEISFINNQQQGLTVKIILPMD